MADPIDRMIDDLRAEQAGETARDPLGRLLEELWAESKGAPPPSPPSPPPAQPRQAPRAPPAPPPLPARRSPEGPLASPERAIAQLAEEERKKKKERAEQWLRALDPYSTEGMWFHDLAKRYATPLEAAIEYLESVKGGR